MKKKKIVLRMVAAVFFGVVSLWAQTQGRVGMNLLYMIPYGSAATDYSNPGVGIGLMAVVPIEPVDQIFAVVGGAEIVSLHMQSKYFQDYAGEYEQRTTQNYSRFLIGFQIGGYNQEFIRPHGGLNLAIVHYNISTDIIDPDNNHETIAAHGKTIVGCDMTFGLNLNFHNVWDLDFGVRYVKSFGLVQQLGEGSVTVHPEYFQAYIGAGMSFDYLFRLAHPSEDDEE
jgi:hypothetical protein